MGVKIEVVDDTMLVHGTPEIKGVPVSSHNDHRIAMAAAVAALNADGAMEIADAQAINKSYPGFYDDLKKLNARVENVSTEA